jgi:hypothetical protein
MQTCDLTFEKLEDRKLLAVSVTQKGTTLNVVGNNANDNVEIDGIAPGVVVVTDNSTGLSTLHIGVRNINVDTKGGQDVVVVGGNTAFLDLGGGTLKINTGDNNDFVAVTGLANSALTIDTGKGTDVALVVNSLVVGKATVNTGSEDDIVVFDTVIFANDVSVDTGSGVDLFAADNISVSGNLTVKLGSGNDFLALTNSLVGGKLSIDGQAGIDEIVDATGTFVLGGISVKSIEIP